MYVGYDRCNAADSICKWSRLRHICVRRCKTVSCLVLRICARFCFMFLATRRTDSLDFWMITLGATDTHAAQTLKHTEANGPNRPRLCAGTHDLLGHFHFEWHLHWRWRTAAHLINTDTHTHFLWNMFV